MERPENQDWQRACVKCGKVKCAKPEKVAEWMREATGDVFKYVETFATEDQRIMGDLRGQIGKFSVMMEIFLVGWSRLLDGVCYGCQPEAFPQEHERLDSPDGMNFEHWRRWAFAAPVIAEQKARDAIRAEVLADVAATGPAGAAIAAELTPPATWRIKTAKGDMDAPCAWARGGLVVVMLGEANLEKALAERAAGQEDAYPAQCWTITHASSGLAIAQSWEVADDAIEQARRLLPLLDWTLPMDALQAAMKASPEAQRGVQFARAVGHHWD